MFSNLKSSVSERLFRGRVPRGCVVIERRIGVDRDVIHIKRGGRRYAPGLSQLLADGHRAILTLEDPLTDRLFEVKLENRGGRPLRDGERLGFRRRFIVHHTRLTR